MGKKKAKSGDGHIEKTKSGKYACTIVSMCVDPATGNYKKIKRTRDTPEEARAACKLAVKAYEKEWEERNDYKQGATLTFYEYVEDYLKKEVKGTVAESTFYSYTCDARQYIKNKAIAKMQLKNLTKKRFQTYYDVLTEKYSPRSIEFAVQLCRRTCKWLVERSLLEENFAEQAKPKYDVVDDFEYVKDLKHKKIFTDEDLQKIYDAEKNGIKSEYISVVVFLLETGLRPQEFACLTNTDIDFDKKQVYVGKTCNRRFADATQTDTEMYVKVVKTKEARYVPLSDMAVKQIKKMQFATEQYCKNNPMDLLYPVFRGGKIRSNATMEVGFKKLCDMLDIDRDVHPTKGGQQIGINLYACRHTCETLQERAGVSPLMIGAMLGHKPETGLKHYTHITADDVAKQMKTPYELMGRDGETDSEQDISEAEELLLLKKLMEKYKDKL